MLAEGGELNGAQFFTPETVKPMTTTLTNGPDKVLLIDTAFSAGL
jgi:hypothetical protein